MNILRRVAWEPILTLGLMAVFASVGLAQQFQVQEVASADGVVQTTNVCDSDAALDRPFFRESN